MLVAVPHDEATALAGTLWRGFAHSGSWGWIWDNLRVPSTSARCDDGSALRHAATIVPDAPDLLLFDVDADRPAARRGSLGEILAHLDDTYWSEWLIAPADLAWFVCENHHDVLIGAGEPVEGRMLAAVPGATRR